MLPLFPPKQFTGVVVVLALNAADGCVTVVVVVVKQALASVTVTA
jgi:hypothetical protein